MPVPSLISDLDTNAANNSPPGTESAKGNIDNYLRAAFAFIKQTSNLTAGATAMLASASTVAIGAAAVNNITISGSATISAFDTVAEGSLRYVTFSGAATLTHNATSLILPGAANIVTAANDTAIFKSLGSGNWQCLFYQRGNGSVLGTTPAQFDNSAKPATTAFVQQFGLQASAVVILTASTTLTAANCGQSIIGGSASPFTLLVPLAAACPAGTRIEFFNANAGMMTITRQGTDVINAAATRFSMAVPIGESLTLESNGVSSWYAVGGSAQLQYGSLFAASLTSSPYQAMPSGTIMQSGAATCDASGNAVVTFPKAFTTTLCVVATPLISQANTYAMNIATRSPTGFSAIGTLGNAGVNSLNFNWIAFGY